jgi:uncharacterized protein (TIGR02001 family)
MKMKQKLVASAVALSAFAGLAVPAAHAEVGASVGVANMYYWRGLDLGLGDPALIGDVNVKGGGFYAGLWASSGDAVAGTEWDIYGGYGFSAGAFSADFNYTTYMYPSPELGPNDLADVAVTLGFKASDSVSFAAMYREGISDLGDTNYSYATVSGTFGPVTALYGTHSDDGAIDGLSHVDLTYAYNSKLSFTLGKVVDDADGAYNDEVKFVVKLMLPIE